MTVTPFLYKCFPLFKNKAIQTSKHRTVLMQVIARAHMLALAECSSTH